MEATRAQNRTTVGVVRRALIELERSCDNACVFCGQQGLEPLGPVDLDRALAHARGDTDEVTFGGGEPTLAPALPHAVVRARALGFARIGVQTHARHLASGALLDDLVSRGLTDVHVSLHGARADVHEYHTGVDGSYEGALAGARACVDRRLEVVVATVLTRSNARSLTALPALLRGLGISAWCLVVPRVAGRAVADFDRVYPRLGLALPYALHALQAARELGLVTWMRGAPACGLGPFAEHTLEDEPRSYGQACEGCAARAQCPGLDGHYLARFDGDELRARDPVPARSHGEHARLARMFVGPGTLAPVPAPRSAPEFASPARARRALPVLGKVAPATAEVPGSTAKQSGDALRELFPALFDRETER